MARDDIALEFDVPADSFEVDLVPRVGDGRDEEMEAARARMSPR
ncbi:hypothetical protein [Actinocorallia herbida]|nr:hypothetical protein [Actinocorallia herbida]